ncbi:MAG TPA: FMN-binding protein [Acidimicrobiales bacterium]|nr:FMN-binding protein [Acidimicrobiales bacterium]
MKRAIIFSSATAAGLAGVLSFHTAPVSLTLGSVGSTAGAGTNGAGSPATSSPPPTTTPPTTVPPTTTVAKKATKSKKSTSSPTTTRPPSTTTSTAPPATTTTVATGIRSATGELVNYYFGVLSVSVTVTGKKIDSVKIGQLSDGGNSRSQQIDQMSIPILEQEAVQAQGPQVQSVSGASYTSAGFVMSLQSALKKLGV